MTKEDKSKRRIEIEDKRGRQDSTKAPSAESQLESQAAMDEKLLKLADAVAGGQPAEKPSEAGGDQTEFARPDTPADYPPLADGDVPWPQRAMEYLELARRKEAELQNYRKRVYKDLDAARRFAVEGLLVDLFPALDGLAQAVRSYAEMPEGESPMVDGVRRTVKVLETAFSKHGIEKINEVMVPFNPELHQALNVEQSSEVTTDTVAEVYVEGYRLGDTVLKPAMVRVIKPG